MTILLYGPIALLAIMTSALTPLALRLVGLPRLASAALPTGILAAGSLWLPSGWAAIVVAPYCVVCALAALVGIKRLLARPTPPSQLAMHIGTIMLAGAATWLFAYSAGIPLLGYKAFWVLLTAAHFHVAGAYLAIIVGWAAHKRGWPAQAVALGCVLGVPMTAIGINCSHTLEVAGGIVMAVSGLGAAHVFVSIPRLRLAAVPLVLGMVLALGYALRGLGFAFHFGNLDPLASMIISHGVLDTLFAAIAFVSLMRSRPRVLGTPPLSQLVGAWPVDADFFVRRGIARIPDEPPRGLVDNLSDLAHEDMLPAAVEPAIRAFYENTASHDMIVRPRWRFGFRTGARVWAAFARRMGQLQLPVRTETGSEGITSRIVALAPDLDGRTSPRAWIRTFPDGRALYVAAYATHRMGDRAYMNIAFPVPGGQLSSILRMDLHGRGVRVSTRLGGDCGIWLVLFGLRIRLPLSETIDVWVAHDPDAPADLRAWADGYTTIARHDLWLFGVPYLSLHYAMRRHVGEP